MIGSESNIQGTSSIWEAMFLINPIMIYSSTGYIVHVVFMMYYNIVVAQVFADAVFRQ